MTDALITRRGNVAGTVALLLVQIAVGYEWLVSGLTKLGHGDFPGGLAAELAEMGKQAPAWYRGFLTDAVIPHAPAFGYAIELAELAVGLVLAGAGFALLVGSGTERARCALLRATGAAALVGIVMAVNFEIANGGHFGTTLASDSFDEGVDLDTIMVALQLALLVFCVGSLRSAAARRTRPKRVPGPGAARQMPAR